jgi:hypothetical protein
MLKIKKVTKETDGTTTAELSLTSDQASFLLGYAITDLVERGLASVEDEYEFPETEGGMQ